MTLKNRASHKFQKVALPPGSLVYTGKQTMEAVEIHLIDYNGNTFQEKELSKIDDILPFKELPTVTWVNINGLYNIELIEKIGQLFSIHPLILEDILSINQRPKMEEYENILFIVLRILRYHDETNSVESEQVSFILGNNFLFTFQEKPGDVFDPVRARLRQNKGKIRTLGPDYLAYSLIDAIVDNYFLVLEKIGDWIEDLEDRLIQNPTHDILKNLHNLKRELINLRKSVWPLRDLLSGLERSDSPLIQKTTVIYLRDVYDHTIQIIDTIESYRDIVSGMLDTYLSSVSNKMNEIMKVLTIIATIFIPLTFIAGVYGMNFEYMPELHWKWGYPVVWLVMIAIALFMVIFFRKKKWL
ncbi:MAG: magnesium/cobalt transporter CorA [Candidatus Marinimicrobia bacterium]|nr:magnesium/cobalt transporter CorA [Candidatus Neomarinimicrobiota bacterium]MDD5582237.1 magnesium/cobalt transporter CorA [Candidatus Neomarinimicrobiota bacterium]